jgi:hypothetical protein
MMPGDRHQEARIVATAMQELSQTPVSSDPIPSASFLWWKAQLLRRWDAEREALAPIEVGERVHLIAAVVGAVALAASAWDQLWVLSRAPLAGVALGLGAMVVLALVMLAAAAARR